MTQDSRAFVKAKGINSFSKMVRAIPDWNRSFTLLNLFVKLHYKPVEHINAQDSSAEANELRQWQID